jgi:hypothetical protein
VKRYSAGSASTPTISRACATTSGSSANRAVTSTGAGDVVIARACHAAGRLTASVPPSHPADTVTT